MDCAAISAEAQSNASRLDVLVDQIKKKQVQNAVVDAASRISFVFLLARDYRDAGGREASALFARQRHLLTLAEQRCAGNIPMALQKLPPAPDGGAPLGPPPPAPGPATAATAVRALDCSDPDGARFRVTGTACPTPSTQFAGVAAGQVRCPQPGMQFRGSDSKSYLISVQDLGNHTCRYRDSRSGRYSDRILTLDMSEDVEKDNADAIRSIIPLQIGNKTSFHHSGGRWHYELSVEKYEEAATPVGRFPTFVLLYRELGLTSPNAVREHRWWYAPSIGYAVKFEYRAVQGPPPSSAPTNWELVELQAP
jgi:hypothetical protein